MILMFITDSGTFTVVGQGEVCWRRHPCSSQGRRSCVTDLWYVAC